MVDVGGIDGCRQTLFGHDLYCGTSSPSDGFVLRVDVHHTCFWIRKTRQIESVAEFSAQQEFRRTVFFFFIWASNRAQILPLKRLSRTWQCRM